LLEAGKRDVPRRGIDPKEKKKEGDFEVVRRVRPRRKVTRGDAKR